MKNRIKYFGVAIAVTMAAGIGTAAGAEFFPQTRTVTETVFYQTPVMAPTDVYGCQTEDSCTADYNDGVWTITPDVP
jgi:hypothetical protein